eukprot:scaffold130055_cov63-Phaeocystis_antarctica.AAC.6
MLRHAPQWQLHEQGVELHAISRRRRDPRLAADERDELVVVAEGRRRHVRHAGQALDDAHARGA